MENSLIFYQILSNSSLRKYLEISVENFHVDIGLGGGVGTLYNGLYRDGFTALPFAGFRHMKE